MGTLTIDEIVIPSSLADENAADFIATVDVRNAVEADGYGSDEFAFTAAELLPGWLDMEYEPKMMFGARLDGRIVARAIIETRPGNESGVGWLQVQVHPDFRRQGIGGALGDTLEQVARQQRLTRLLVYVVSREAPGERLPSPTGFGSVPLGNAEVRFLLKRGYMLEQVERGSRLALPVDDALLRSRFDEASALAGPDYAVHTWVGTTPGRWREDIAMLLTRMSTDAPTAGLEEPEDPWTVERVLAYEANHASDPRTEITAAIEHVPTGRLVGFTGLTTPVETSRPANQEDTIVVREHRGHRLGMLLKVANLMQLQRVRPGHPAIITFNAEENRHMLAVNEAVGFLPIAYEGAWKKLLGYPVGAARRSR